MRAEPSRPEDVLRLHQAVAATRQLFASVGARELAAQNRVVRAARYGLSAAIDLPEIERVLARVDGFDGWYPAWAERAAHYETLGDAAAAAGRRRTAATQLQRAAGLWHVAQILLLDDDERKAQGHRHCVAAYRQGLPHHDPPVEPVRLQGLPALFRGPRDRRGAAPAVILLNGANTVKEELHHYSDDFLARGLCTLVLEGPGQGEASARYGHPGLRVDRYVAAVRAAVDWLAVHPEVAADRIGIWGVSFGGFLALRCAAEEPRLRAALSLGGFDDLRSLPRLSPLLLEEFRVLMGLDSFADVLAQVAADCRLSEHVGRIGCPYLVVHGGRDDLLDEAEAQRMASGPSGELLVYPDGVHGCYNLNLEVAPMMADWMAERLHA